MIPFRRGGATVQPAPRLRFWRDTWTHRLLFVTRAIVVGVAYFSVIRIPGLTSAMVAIFTAALAYDLLVAAPSIHPRRAEFQALLAALRRTLLATFRSLAKGLILGVVLGSFTFIGLPHAVGAVLTVGLGYTWSVMHRSGFAEFVAVLAGLAVFEQIQGLDTSSGLSPFVETVLPVAYTTVRGTILAHFAGWLVGLTVGTGVRALLPRPYRTRLSAAYDPPMEQRPFGAVVHAGRGYELIEAEVPPGSPWVGRSLSELRFRTQYAATVIVIHRGDKEIVMPTGDDVLLAHDRLVLLCPADARERIEQTLMPASM